MSFKFTDLIFLIIVFSLIIKMVIEKKDNSVPSSLMWLGVMYISKNILTIEDKFFSLVASYLGIELTVSEYSSQDFGFGLLLILISVILSYKLNERIHILNMLGIRKKEISDEKSKSDLKIADYKLKEQLLDIIPLFQNGECINSKVNASIITQIKEDVFKFAGKSKDKGGCFTGLAPIPYTIFAGTFLGEANINRYFEFNRNEGETYYELKEKTPFKKKQWDSLELEKPETMENATDVVLALSISHRVLDTDLEQFKGLQRIHLGLPAPKDNVIQYKEQLIEYKKSIYNCLDVTLKEWFPNLKTIHLVASIPSCMSLEIGKTIGMGTNRMADIISYHYIHSCPIKYPFGVYVSGTKKGDLVKVKE
jgi:hypothetical protein